MTDSEQYLAVESALAFLLTHDLQDAKGLAGLEILLESKLGPEDRQNKAVAPFVVQDRSAFVTVRTTSTQPFQQDITVEVPDLNLTFTHSGSFQWSSGQYRIADCNRVQGTIFLRGQNPPREQNVGFNAQQFPQYGSGDPTRGRITIDFWNNQRITGVFKTDVDNYAHGHSTSGRWN